MSPKEELRGYLLLLGLVVLIGVFWFTKYPSRFFKKRVSPKSQPPPAPPVPRDSTPVAVSQPPKTLVVCLRAASGELFSGTRILQAAKKAGLEAFGEHRGSFRFVVDGQEEKKTRFLVASMYEPGEFEWEKMDEYRTGGLSFIAVFQPNSDARLVRKYLLDRAVLMAGQLGGEVLDENQQVFSPTPDQPRE